MEQSNKRKKLINKYKYRCIIINNEEYFMLNEWCFDNGIKYNYIYGRVKGLLNWTDDKKREVKTLLLLSRVFVNKEDFLKKAKL